MSAGWWASRGSRLRVLPPIDAPTRWHVSPSVDLAGYAFGWVLLAVPMYWLMIPYPLEIRDARPEAFWLLAIATLALDVHRHFTFPYVYLDRRVRSRFPLRFFLLPAVIAALFTQMPFWNESGRALEVSSACAVVAWAFVIIELMVEDAMGAARRANALRSTLAAACLAAGVSGALAFVPAPPGALGWTWLLAATVASVGRMLGTRVGGADPSAGWLRLAPPVAIGGAVGVAATFDGALTVGSLVNAGIAVYVLWLLYHGNMQKYGIMRLYSAKSGHAAKVPRWVDALLVWSWIPMVIIWGIGTMAWVALSYLDGMSHGTGRFIGPAIAFVDAHFEALVAAAAAGIAASLAAFFYFEWRLHRLRNVPRLAFGLGTQLFHSSVLVLGPVGWYVVGATMHGIEYITFVWAFQRRRYRGVDPAAPLLSRLVAHPFLFYVVGSVAISVVIFFAHFSHSYLGFSPESITIGGARLTTWAIWYSILQGIPHFFYDGFLWKMRQEELSESL